MRAKVREKSDELDIMGTPLNNFESECNGVERELWPFERKAVKKSLSRLSKTNPPKLNESVTREGVAATVFWLASLLWAEVAAMLTVIGLPLSVIGIFDPRHLRYLLVIGLVIGFFVILSALLSWLRQSKRQNLRAQFQSTLAGHIVT